MRIVGLQTRDNRLVGADRLEEFLIGEADHRRIVQAVDLARTDAGTLVFGDHRVLLPNLPPDLRGLGISVLD